MLMHWIPYPKRASQVLFDNMMMIATHALCLLHALQHVKPRSWAGGRAD